MLCRKDCCKKVSRLSLGLYFAIAHEDKTQASCKMLVLSLISMSRIYLVLGVPDKMSPQKTLQYRVYILRCWPVERTAQDNTPVWRFSVEEVLGKRRQATDKLSDLEAVCDFLYNKLYGHPPADS